MHGSSINDIHPILVHFPILLFSFGLLFDLLNGIGKKWALRVAHWMIIAGAIMSLPTVLTGWIAANMLPPDHPHLHQHHLFAFITTSYGIAHALFRASVIHKKWEFSPLVFVTCSVINLILIAITANYGTLVMHGHSLFF